MRKKVLDAAIKGLMQSAGCPKRELLVAFGDASLSHTSPGHAPSPRRRWVVERMRRVHHLDVLDIGQFNTSKMSNPSKTIGDKLHEAWDTLTEPKHPGVEVGADLQAQAAAYDYANAAPDPVDEARAAADLAAAKTDDARQEAVSGIRGQGQQLADALTGTGSGLSTAKDYASSATAKLSESHASAQESAHQAQTNAVQSMRDTGAHIAEGLSTAGEKTNETVAAVRSKLGL